MTETSTPFSPSAGLTGPDAQEAWFRRVRPGVAIGVLAAAASAVLTGVVLVVLTGADDVLQLTAGAPVARTAPNFPVLAVLALASSGLLGVVIGRCIWHRPGRSRVGDGLLLAHDMATFRGVAETLPIPIVLTSMNDGTILFRNSQSADQFRVPPASVPAPDTLPFYVDPADRQRILDQLERDGFVKNAEAEMRRRDGSTFWALISATIVTLDGHRSTLSMYHDISDRKAADAALLDSEVRYALISRAANDGLWDWDIPSGEVFYSSRWKEIVDSAPGDRFNSLEDWLVRVHPEDVGRLRRDIDRHVAGETTQLDTEYRIRRGDGGYAWMSCRGIALRDGGGTPIRMAGSQTDITLRKSYELTLRSAAYRDGLTGLNNRAYFTEIIDARPTVADIANTALILINLDRFRRLNDSLGTGAGDAVLIALGKRLSACASPGDVVARLGSDEFAFWFSNIADEAAIRVEADALITELSRPVLLGELEVPMLLSFGMATPGQGDAASGADMLRNARLALDHARALGGGRIELFDEVLLRETRLRQRLSSDLTSAHRLGQIFFDYQPVIEMKSGRIAGFEALMRWRHPELGGISPATFIPIAEDAGLIGKLGQFAIESAARQIDIWTRDGLIQGEFSVAVNLSARQISDRVGIARLLALLDRLALPPGRLKLELTESVLMQDPEAMAPALQKFRDRGVELSLDDFGTGYSSLSYLHRFALDVLKIDRSFVSRMLVAPEAYRLVRSIIDLAHDLGLKVVAEGVEVADEVASLKALGCDFAQGFFFSRPIPPDQAAALLLKQSN